MSNGGRVVSHEAAILPQRNATVLIVGYQAAGSLGRRLAEGEKKVSIKGSLVRVHARVETLYSYSAHMDSAQLLAFAQAVGENAKEIFVVMGEPASASFLAQRIRDYAGLHATTPEAGATAKLAL
jgi:metallo-beta-lactamase family protein